MTTSIGPLANPDYYLRMQRSHQAANGYYTGGGEPDGIWWNPAGLLGLQHGATVGTDAFYRLCEGFSPDGEKLTQNAGSEKRSAGLDLTFSADKSVSAVWAVAGERLRTAIADAHTAAVQYTLEHVTEAHCATTRIRTRAANGARGELAIVPADLIAALFQHGTSRADDPQLHTHCTVMNAARAHFDGKYRALNKYPLYRWKMAAGATYRNHLAWGLRGLGFKVEQHGKDGAFTRIAGVPRALEAHWSKRTAQIEAFARDNGFDVTANPQLHTAANHLTRAPKRDTGDDEAKRSRPSSATSLAVISRLSGCASSPPGSSNYLSASRARSRSSATPRWLRRFETPPRGSCTRMRPGPRSSGCFARRRSFG